MPFNKETAKIAGKKGKRAGTKNKKTIVKEALGLKNIEQLQPKVLAVWNKFIESADEEKQIIAAKEISKYVFSTKKETAIDLTAKGNINIFTVKPDSADG